MPEFKANRSVHKEYPREKRDYVEEIKNREIVYEENPQDKYFDEICREFDKKRKNPIGNFVEKLNKKRESKK